MLLCFSRDRDLTVEKLASFCHPTCRARRPLLGKFSKEESRTVVEAVKHYAMTNGVSVEVSLALASASAKVSIDVLKASPEVDACRGNWLLLSILFV